MKKTVLLIMLLTVSTYAKWTYSFDKDKMIGEKTAYAFSPVAKPDPNLSFPYGDTVGTFVIACNQDSEWVYLSFSESPNIPDVEVRDGYNIITTRIKVNTENPEIITLTQDWGDRILRFSGSSETIIGMLPKIKALLLELNWYGNGNVYFDFNLKGAKSALKKIRHYCVPKVCPQ